MKLLLRLTVLALAAVGAQSLYQRFRPRVEAVGDTGARIGDTVKPAFREAATSVKNASTHAAHQVADATHRVVEDLADAATTPVDADAPTRAGAPAVETADAAGPVG